MTQAPTRDELLQALQAIVTDMFGTYQALARNEVPIVSVGQWGRLRRAQGLVGREAEATSS